MSPNRVKSGPGAPGRPLRSSAAPRTRICGHCPQRIASSAPLSERRRPAEVVARVGAHRREPRVEPLGHALRKGEPGQRAGEPVLVGVEKRPLVPSRPREAEEGAEEDDGEEDAGSHRGASAGPLARRNGGRGLSPRSPRETRGLAQSDREDDEGERPGQGRVRRREEAGRQGEGAERRRDEERAEEALPRHDRAEEVEERGLVQERRQRYRTRPRRREAGRFTAV